MFHIVNAGKSSPQKKSGQRRPSFGGYGDKSPSKRRSPKSGHIICMRLRESCDSAKQPKSAALLAILPRPHNSADRSYAAPAPASPNICGICERPMHDHYHRGGGAYLLQLRSLPKTACFTPATTATVVHSSTTCVVCCLLLLSCSLFFFFSRLHHLHQLNRQSKPG